MAFGDDILSFGELLDRIHKAEGAKYRNDNEMREEIAAEYHYAVREMLYKLSEKFDPK